MKKKAVIPVGYEDLKEIIEQNMYYVDKSLMKKELPDTPAKVGLFTRLRRFGKTLDLSMFRRSFELELEQEGAMVDHWNLFDGLKIFSCRETYLSHDQQYPFINLSLKAA